MVCGGDGPQSDCGGPRGGAVAMVCGGDEPQSDCGGPRGERWRRLRGGGVAAGWLG
jgi:hypothetical protein